MDEQSAKQLVDYFASGAAPTATADETPAAPLEGGQGEVGELTPAGRAAAISQEDAKRLADYFTQGQQPGGLGPLADVLFATTGPGGPALNWLAQNVPAFRDYVKSNVAAGVDVVSGAASLGRWPLEAPFAAAGVEEPGPLKFLSDRLKSIQAGAPAVKAEAEAVLPTSQDLDQSPVGQIASGLGNLGAQIPFSLMGPEVAVPMLAAQFAGQTYDEAKAKGADDRTAQIAALFNAAFSPIQAAVLHNLPIGNLSQMLAGSTPAKAIMDVGRGMLFGGAAGGLMQGYQNLVARLSGYDPNRPLDEGVYQQALFGAAVDGLATAASRVPGMIRYARPAQVDVRERPGAPPVAEQTPQPTEAPPPAAAPAPEAAPAAEPLAEAAAMVQESTGAPPEQVLAQQGTPEEALAKSESEFHRAVGGAPAAPEPVTTAEAAKVTPETPIAPAAPAAPQRTYDEIQREIDQEETRLENSGVDIGRQPMPEKLQSLYDERDAAGSRELAQTRAQIVDRLTNIGLSQGEINRVLDFYAIDPTRTGAAEQYLASTHGVRIAEGDPTAQSERLASALAAERGEKYDELKDISPSTIRDAANAVKTVRQFMGLEGPSNLRGEVLPPPLPATETALRPSQVKDTVNQAGESMGLDSRIHYVENADQLPNRVQKALTQEQQSGTAQMVYDKTMGELWVIGDRFSSQEELNRALIHDTLPRIYGGLSDLVIENNPRDPRLGYYDLQGDRPVLNEAAILRTANPFEAASKTALEEIVAHQGITKLYGARESDAYVRAMTQVRQRFDSLKLTDTLAREKGFNGLDDMAKAYGFEDYAKNPRHNNALTEELWAAYAQRFKTLDALQNNSPSWYRQAINTLSGGLRRRFGLGMSNLDVQNLVSDSFGALRNPKYATPSEFQPEIAAQAKRDMAAYRGETYPGPSPGRMQAVREAYNEIRKNQLGSAVFISDLAKNLGASVPELQAHLLAEQRQGSAILDEGHWPSATAEQRAAAIAVPQMRAGDRPRLVVRFPSEQLASLRGEEAGGQGELPFGRAEQERRQAEEAAAGRLPPPPPAPGETAQVGTEFVRGRAAELAAGLRPGEGLRAQPFGLAAEEGRPFGERMGYLAERAGAVYDKRGFDMVMNEARDIFHRDLGGDIYRAMDDLRAMGGAVADAHPAMRAVINEETNRQINTLRTQGLENTARSMEAARDRFNQEMAPKVTALAQALNAQKLLYETGTTAIGRLRAGLTEAQGKRVGRAAGVNDSYDRVRRIGVDTINRLLERSRAQLEPLQQMIDNRLNNPQSIAQRYINALAAEINNRMARLGFQPAERPILQELFNRFGRSIQEMINEKAAPIPTPEAAKRMSATDTIRETLANFPMFQRAWEETVTRLKTDNPNSLFFGRLDHALAEPFGEKAVGRVVRESGQSLRDLIFRHADTQARVGNTLAEGLMRNAGMSPDQALRTQELFDRYYRNLLNATARNELEQTMKRIGGPSRDPKGELDRLVDLMAIGALDKQEYYNLLAPRFGLGQWSPELIGRMKEIGGMLQRLRDEGGPEVYKNQLAHKLADEIARTQPRLDINIRRAEGLWMASLLTGPFTHGSYWVQNAAQVMTNMALRSLFRPGATLAEVGKTYSDMFGAMIHSARTELPYIVRTGARTQRELPGGEVYGARAEAIPFRSALEATPLPNIPGLGVNPLNWYRYVGRVLHGMETVFYRGASAGITRALADRLAVERGMGSEEATRWVEQVVYGTENDRQQALQQASDEQKRFGFDDGTRERRVQELIDQKRFARAPELADETHRFALHSAYRESPYGYLGKIARTISELRREDPQLSLVTPFINLPANVANEFMNWTPIGLLRGRDAITGGTEGIEKLYKDVPQFQRLVEKGRQLAEKGKKGGIGDAELRDLSYEYLAKGAIGTIGMAALGAMTLANRDNPDPPFAVNGAGPADLAHRDELRAAGWQPYSIKIGDRYFDYQASPWKSMLGLVGGMADEIKYGKGDPQNWIGALATTAAKDGLSTITDASFLQGLQTLLAAGGGSGGPGVDYKIQQFLSQEASSALMIPFGGTGTKQLYRAFDPREFGGKDIMGMVLRNIPFANSAFLQPKLNALGEPVEINPLHRLLVAPTVQSADPVWKFLDQHNIGLSVPNAGRKVDGVQMTPAELHEFTQIRGQYLKNELAQAIASDSFRGLDRDQMDQDVKDIERQADEVGKYQIWRKRQGR